MKKFILGLFAVALAVGFSAFKPAFFATLNVAQPVIIDELNVEDPASYVTSSVICSGTPTNPCVLDLNLILPAGSVTNEAQFLTYLATFPSDAARVTEVKRIAISKKP